MNKLLILALAWLLSACASATLPPTKQQGVSVSAFATLASFGTFEMQLAPAYTRLAVLRHNAARALDKGRIPVDAAQEIQAGADAVRAQLDRARYLDAGKAADAAAASLDDALRGLEQLERRLR